MPGKKKLKKKLKRAERVKSNKLFRRMKRIRDEKLALAEEEKQRKLDEEAMKLCEMRSKQDNVVPTGPNVFKKERWACKAKNEISDSSKSECGFDRSAWVKRAESSVKSEGNG